MNALHPPPLAPEAGALDPWPDAAGTLRLVRRLSGGCGAVLLLLGVLGATPLGAEARSSRLAGVAAGAVLLALAGLLATLPMAWARSRVGRASLPPKPVRGRWARLLPRRPGRLDPAGRLARMARRPQGIIVPVLGACAAWAVWRWPAASGPLAHATLLGGGVVLLSATVAYRVADGAAYHLARGHVEPALQRLFSASAVGVAAARELDDVLVARPDRGDAARSVSVENRRQALRGDLLAAMNRRLADLDACGASLGVVVARIDLDAALPPAAKIAFDGVLVAVQLAEQGIAGARTEATRTLQAADRERDRLLTTAQASAAERVGEARNRTAGIAAIGAGMTPAGRPATLDQLYRDRLALLLHKVGRLVAVDAGGARVILPATSPAGAGP